MVDHDKLRDPNAEYTMRDLSAAETMDITNSRGGVRDAEITDVQTTMVDGNYPWILVRVYTDAGVVGTGESYWGGGDTAIIERMKPFIVGENPLDIDRLYEHLVQKMSGEGSISGRSSPPSPVSRSRSTTPPGSSSTCPPTSSSAGSTATRSGSTATSTENEADPQACAAEAERVVENFGYDAIKFDLDVPSGHEKDRANRHLRNPEIDHKVDIVEATTEAVGDKADVAFDCHWSFTGGSAKPLARRPSRSTTCGGSKTPCRRRTTTCKRK